MYGQCMGNVWAMYGQCMDLTAHLTMIRLNLLLKHVTLDVSLVSYLIIASANALIVHNSEPEQEWSLREREEEELSEVI